MKKYKPQIIFTIIFLLLPSNVFSHLMGLNMQMTFAFLLTLVSLILGYTSVNFKSSKSLIVFLFLLTLSSIAAFISKSFSQFYLGAALVLMIFFSQNIVVFFSGQKFNTYIFNTSLAMLVLAWVGLIYSLLGGDPLFCIDNPDGRASCLYFSTFSNTDNVAFWGVIRPSGIFDEPGALSFYTVLVVCLNDLSQGSKIRSFILLFLGLVTLSLAHILILFIYSAIFLRKNIIKLIAACFIIIFTSSLFPEDSIVYLNIIQRFSQSEYGGFKGDNRSNQVSEFISLLTWDISIHGDNIINKKLGTESEAIDQSANPFSIWFSYGLLMWIPYFLCLCICIFIFFSSRGAVSTSSILVFLLLLQRPYIYSLQWGVAIFSVLSLLFYVRKKLN